MSVESILHININCRNFERSIQFYELLGYKCLFDPIENMALPPQVAQGLGLPDGSTVHKMVLMGLNGIFAGVLIDLIEWAEPSNFPERLDNCAAPGASRIALVVSNLDETSNKLADSNFRPVGPPGKAEDILNFHCYYDPDGLVIELVKFQQGQSSRDDYLKAFENLSANKSTN